MKKTARNTLFLLTLCRIGFAESPAAPEPKTLSCPVLSEKIDDTDIEIAELTHAREELLAKFKGLVVEDVKAQADGLIDELQKNEAIKVSYTRRKLTKSIEDKTSFAKSIREEYCVRCVNSLKNEFAKASFCAKCPGKIECDSKPSEEAPKDS